MNILRLFLFSALLLGVDRPLRADPVALQPTPPPEAVVTPGQPFDPAAATEAWLATVPAEKRARSDAYFEGGYWLLLWNYLLSIAVLWLLLRLGISARIRSWAERCAGRWPMQVALYSVGFVLLNAVIGFPLYCYQNFAREHAYGMATQTFGPWFGEQVLALGLNLLLAPIGFIILYAVVRRAPRSWWIWATVASAVGLAVLIFLAPIFVEPLFNTYKPLSDPALKEPILALARANQIPVTQVYEVDASRQTRRISANVAGFMGTTRIALNDNLLRACSLPEIREVMAHEMGHYVLNHISKIILEEAVVFFVLFGLVHLISASVLPRWGADWQVRGLEDPAAFPLIALVFVSAAFILTPVTNTIIRSGEREADIFALNASREPEGAAAIALKLGAYRKLSPTPLEEFLFYDHPSGRSRIRMAMDWKAGQLPCETGRR